MSRFATRPVCRRIALVALVALVSLAAGVGIACAASPETARKPFRTFFVTRSLAHEQLLPYLRAARPEVVQIGNYGAMFHGYADDPKSTGWPMQLPVAGEREALDFQRKLNDQAHQLGLKVVGHFRLAKVMGNWDERSGFVEYYNERWPADLLGPKPHAKLSELLAVDADGKPLQLGRSGHAQLAFCVSSPHARKMFKQMLKVAVDHGVDGVMTNFNYRYDCGCAHCQRAFKAWLNERLSAAEFRSRLGIENLDQYEFGVIPAHVPGYPDAAEASELDWLAIEWGAEHFKRMFDEIFVEYGRTLKKDLLVGQWNHLSHVSRAEERMFLPLRQWGRGEDYFWYSGGAAFVGKNLSLSQGKAGDAWLSCLYVRELGGNKPFVMGKYDGIRMAASMAEGYATGGIGMGRYMRFEDPHAFEVLARYTNFMHRHRRLYDGAKRHADAALILPRQSVLQRHPESLDAFRELGQALVERGTIIDVVADETLSDERLAQYQAAILPKTLALSDEQIKAIECFASAGRLVIRYGECGTLNEQGQPRKQPGLAGAVKIGGTATEAADAITARLAKGGNSIIDCPWTVRAAAYTQPGRMVLHLVNYNRDESPPLKKRSGPAAERPIPAEDIGVALRLPAGTQAKSVRLHAPDRDEPLELEFSHDRLGRVTVQVPQLVVYAVVAVEVEAQKQ